MHRRWRVLLACLRLALGAGLLVYVLATSGGWAAAKPLLSHGWLLLAVVGLPFFGAAVEASRLGLLCAAQGVPVAFGQGYRLVAVGALFNFCLLGGNGGDVVKFYYLTTTHRGRGIELALALLIDRGVGLVSLLLLAIGLALLDGQLIRTHALIRWMVTVSALGMGGVVLVVLASGSTTLRASRGYRFLLDRLPYHQALARVSAALAAFRHCQRAVLLAVLVSLLGHLALAAMFLGIGTVLTPQLSGLGIAVLALFGMLANALPITPGGLGTGELAFDHLFTMVGTSGGAQLLVIWRLGVLSLCVIGGLFQMAGVRSKHAPGLGPMAIREEARL
jgi:uncharacterized protein (TIRG00374 family)